MNRFPDMDRDNEILIKQKRLPMGFLAVWLMVITTVQWIVLDMYLPALPVLMDEFSVSEGALNISLNAGIIAAAVSTVVAGTISDRYGRKPILLIGLAIGAAGNLLCALSGGVVFLSLMRALTGVGSGAVQTVAAAMLKDSFCGRRFQKNMTLLQAVAAIGPIFAPALGSFVINVASWRFVFIFLAAAIFITLIPMLLLTETLPPENRFSSNFGDVLKEAGSIARTPSFVLFIGICSFITVPIWSYIGVSSYMYIDEFGLSNMAYSVYYAGTAILSVLAPIIYLAMSRRFVNRRIVTFTVILTILSGALILILGGWHPALLLLAVGPVFLAEGIIRPLGLVILLEEYNHVAGSTSALMQFILNIAGAIGTTLATLGWSSMIMGTGIITSVCAVLTLGCWIAICAKGLLKKNLDAGGRGA